MNYAPFVRIILRYTLGGSGYAALANDNDVIAVGCVVAAALVESAYVFAKKKGWAT